jgi:PKD domain
MSKRFLVPLIFLFLFVPLLLKAQQCLSPGNLVTGKGTAMFMKSIGPNRIVAGGVYTNSQGVFTLGGDTLYPRVGDALTIFAALLDSNLSLVRMFNVIGFTLGGGSFNDTRVWDMHADSLGNIYFCGSFIQDTLLSYTNDTVFGDGYQEAFIVRCDTMGTTTLLKSCGTRSFNFKFEDRAYGICSDAQGNIMVALGGDGRYFTINGDTVNSVTAFSNVSVADIYIISLRPDGSTRWMRSFGTSFRDDVPYDISANARGEVAVCGAVEGSNSVFQFGSFSHTYKYSQYGLHGFVGKLDSSGVPIWLSPIEVYYSNGPKIGAYATAIDDSGYVYSSGYFNAWAIFNGDTIRTLNYTSSYFSKYLLNGQTKFVKMGNIDTFYPFPIYMDLKKGKALITGQSYTNQLTFQQYGHCCSTKSYIVEYSTDGDVQWLRGASSLNASNTGFGMACLNDQGTAFLCGTGSGGLVEISPLQINLNSNANYYLVKFSAAPSNGLSLTISNTGNDTISCGSFATLNRTLQPSIGPQLTWWADNDTIPLPNFVTNLNATPKLNTLYIATASYNGCVVSDSIRVFVEQLPCSAGNDTLICSGQSFSLQGNSIVGASYQWIPSNAVSNSSAQQTNFIGNTSTALIYKIGKAGCFSSDTLNVLVNQPAQSAFTFANNLLAVSLSNSSLNYDSLRWDFGDNTPSSDSINPVHLFQQNGIYSVCLITYNACGNDTLCSPINLSTVGIHGPDNTSFLVRNESSYQIQSTTMIESYSLFDTSGRCIQKGKEKVYSLTLDFSSLAPACYFLHLQTKNGLKQYKLLW